jgi:heme/copper-type cytochrome/quinol oxidase subunit 2
MDIRRNPNQSISTMPLIVFGVLSLVFGLGMYFLFPSLGTLPVQTSVQARNTDELFRVLMGLSGVVFFLVQGLIYYAAIAFRAKANDVSDGPSIHGNTMVEIVWTIIPSVIVVAIAIYSYFIWRDNTTLMVADALNVVNGAPISINAIGQRFAWNFEYRTNEVDDAGEPILFNSTNLHTYVGENVYLQMETRDVIHSLWLPTMRVKQDLLPGRVTDVVFTTVDPELGWEWGAALSPVTVYALEDAASAVVYENLTDTNVELSIYPLTVEMELADPNTAPTGEWTAVRINGADGFVQTSEILGRFNKWRVICAELCGSGHGNMITDVYLWETEEALLNAWYMPRVEEGRVPPAGPVDAGRIALTSGGYGCEGCHTLTSLNWQGAQAPSLDGIGSRADERAVDANEDIATGAEYIAFSLRHPADYLVPGYNPIMPQFTPQRIPQEDLNAIVAYLCTQTDSGDAAASDCGLGNLTFAEDGTLTDVEALEAELSTITIEFED